MKKQIKRLLIRKLILYFAPIISILLLIFGLLCFMIVAVGGGDNSNSGGSSVTFDGTFNDDLPIFDEIKGRGQITDEVARFAVGTAIKYKLLPSVILSQYAYESEWGKSLSAKNDNNFFGITWFAGCPFPKGTARGVGGSEGGNYMKFPNSKNAFSYYGFMIASQSNFNASVGLKSPSESLLILGRGGYASAGITESSPYFTGAMSIINSNKFTDYDEFAIKRWNSYSNSTLDSFTGNKGNISSLNSVLNQRILNGQCYGLTAYYVSQIGGPQLMGSGKIYAQDIGMDYDWSKFGWKVIFNPKPSELQAGDVINWQGNGAIATSIYGHTGIISSVSNGGKTFGTYEQQGDGVQIVKQFIRNYDTNHITSIVRKVK